VVGASSLQLTGAISDRYADLLPPERLIVPIQIVNGATLGHMRLWPLGRLARQNSLAEGWSKDRILEASEWYLAKEIKFRIKGLGIWNVGPHYTGQVSCNPPLVVQDHWVVEAGGVQLKSLISTTEKHWMVGKKNLTRRRWKVIIHVGDEI
jgi:hypothetical protein